MYKWIIVPEKGAWFPGAGVKGSFEPLDFMLGSSVRMARTLHHWALSLALVHSFWDQKIVLNSPVVRTACCMTCHGSPWWRESLVTAKLLCGFPDCVNRDLENKVWFTVKGYKAELSLRSIFEVSWEVGEFWGPWELRRRPGNYAIKKFKLAAENHWGIWVILH